MEGNLPTERDHAIAALEQLHQKLAKYAVGAKIKQADLKSY
jgi:hypothetical protein